MAATVTNGRVMAASSMKASFNDTLQQLTSTTDFACQQNNAPLPQPGLSIADFGDVGLPLSSGVAAAIISRCCRKSAFGKGEQTIVDDTVRRSWELGADQITIKNPAWERMVAGMLVPTIRTKLGLSCEVEDVRAELYKLLVYEEGAFFKAHQDSEKTPGMFGTLMIALPSAHGGGSLQLRHQGETVAVETAADSDFGFSWAAWYSDVFHEVQPVTWGYRVVLTYNLAISSTGSAGRSVAAIPPSLSTHQQHIEALMVQWHTALEKRREDLPRFLVHRFDHQYTLESFNRTSLKGADRTRAEFLKRVADASGAELFLATVELRVDKSEGDLDGNPWDYYDDEGWDDEDEDPYGGGYGDGGGEEIARSEILVGVRAFEDGALVVDELLYDNLVGLQPLDLEDDDPDDEEHSGFTGNEGATATYWYRAAVCLIVPGISLDGFRFHGGPDRWQWAAGRLKDREAALDSASREPPAGLEQFCQQVLVRMPVVYFNGNRTSFLFNDHQKSCIESIAGIALRTGRFALFDNVCSIGRDLLSDKCFKLLGSRMLLDGLAAVQDRIVKALNKRKRLSSRASAYESVARGLCDPQTLSLVKKPSTAVAVGVWVDGPLKRLVTDGDLEPLDKADGASLAIMYWSTGDPARVASLMAMLERSTMAANIGFCLKTNDPAEFPDRSDAEKGVITRKMLLRIWRDFRLDNLPTPSQSMDIPNDASRTATGADLAVVIRLTETHEPFLERSIYNGFVGETLVDACAKATDELTLRATLVPLASLVASKRVPYFLDPSTQKPTETGKALVRTALHRFMTVCVGARPHVPHTWSMHTDSSHCRCRDCAAVIAFLASPTERVGSFPMSKARRQHLHVHFGVGLVGGFVGEEMTASAREDYTVETLRYRNPNVWQVTKNKARHERAMKAWKERLAKAWVVLADLAGVESVQLEEFVGAEMARGLKGRDYEVLLKDERGEAAGPLSDVAGNARKRGHAAAGEGGGEEGAGGSKKRKAVVIDLTEGYDG